MPATLQFDYNPGHRAAAEQAVFGGPLTNLDYADIAGDLLGDAKISVGYDEPWLHGGGPDCANQGSG